MFIVNARRRLQCLVTSVSEGPCPADIHPCQGRLLEHLGDLVPVGGLCGNGHHPVGVEAIEEERGAMEHELDSLGLDKLALVWV